MEAPNVQRSILRELGLIAFGVAAVGGLEAYESGLKQAVERTILLIMFLLQTSWTTMLLVHFVKVRRVRRVSYYCAVIFAIYGYFLGVASINNFIVHTAMSTVLGIVIGILALKNGDRSI